MFERSLSSLINGLRSQKHKAPQDLQKYLATVLDEISKEVRSGDMAVKSQAVLKLTYLQMLGYPVPTASFHILEIMASPRYHLKHVGYLAAAQCFTHDTDVLILATNMIKKDLHSSVPTDVSVALNGLSHIITPDLAQHLAPDIIALLSHTRPRIRKKAVLVLYAVILRFPEALPMSWDRLRTALDDSDRGVVCAAVNIVCELARRDAAPFVALSPQLFSLLTTSTNNWMLIKLVKLFASLTPLEPRLIRKLLPPLTTIIETTPAMSLLYECIHTLIVGGMLGGTETLQSDVDLDAEYIPPTTTAATEALARTCLSKLTRFLQSSDQNLKYISFRALSKMLKTHPALIAADNEQRTIVLDALHDPDLSIRMRALELIGGMVGAGGADLVEACDRLMEGMRRETAPSDVGNSVGGSAADSLKAQLGSTTDTMSVARTVSTSSASYRLAIVNTILNLCGSNTYAHVRDFEWLLDLLVQLARTSAAFPYSSTPSAFARSSEEPGIGARIRNQIIDVTARVRAVRPHAVRSLMDLMRDEEWKSLTTSQDQKEILGAAAWVCGEYCSEVTAPTEVIEVLLSESIVGMASKGVSSLRHSDNPVRPSSSVLYALVHNTTKLFAYWAAKEGEDEGIWSTIEGEEEGPNIATDTPEDERERNLREARKITVAMERREVIQRVKEMAKKLDRGLKRLERDEDAEVQERTVEFRQLLTLLMRDLDVFLESTKGITSASPKGSQTLLLPARPRSLHLLSPLFFSYPLGPVAERAQARVAKPTQFDLETWIIPIGSWTLSGVEDDWADSEDEGRKGSDDGAVFIEDPSEPARRKAERRSRMRDDPFYLVDGAPSSSKSTPTGAERKQAVGSKNSKSSTSKAIRVVDTPTFSDDSDSVPLVQLSLEDVPALSIISKGAPVPAVKNGVNSSSAKSRPPPVRPPVLEAEEMPEETRVKSTLSRSKTKTSTLDRGAQGTGAGISQEGKVVKAKKKKKVARAPVE